MSTSDDITREERLARLRSGTNFERGPSEAYVNGVWEIRRLLRSEGLDVAKRAFDEAVSITYKKAGTNKSIA